MRRKNTRTPAGWSSLLPCAVAIGSLSVGCGDGYQDVTRLSAVAELRPSAGSQVTGQVRFEELDGKGVRIESEVYGLEPGTHAYHVHVNGDCSAPDASSAGPHFDFSGEANATDRITGNLGELTAEASGEVSHEATITLARLSGPNSIAGRAVVVHDRGNDPDVTPSGDAGPRIACGVIEPARP